MTRRRWIDVFYRPSNALISHEEGLHNEGFNGELQTSNKLLEILYKDCYPFISVMLENPR